MSDPARDAGACPAPARAAAQDREGAAPHELAADGGYAAPRPASAAAPPVLGTLVLRPGDRVLLIARDKTTPGALASVMDAWKRRWPDIPVLALSGLDVAVLRVEDDRP